MAKSFSLVSSKRIWLKTKQQTRTPSLLKSTAVVLFPAPRSKGMDDSSSAHDIEQKQFLTWEREVALFSRNKIGPYTQIFVSSRANRKRREGKELFAFPKLAFGSIQRFISLDEWLKLTGQYTRPQFRLRTENSTTLLSCHLRFQRGNKSLRIVTPLLSRGPRCAWWW